MEQENKALTYDDARALDPGNVKPGLRVKGTVAPFGGRWVYDKDADEITLQDANEG